VTSDGIMPGGCGLPADQLEAFLDGALTGAARQRVAEHLTACATCRRAVRSETQLREAFAALPELACPASVLHRIEEATGIAVAAHAPPATSRPAPRRRRWIVAAAAAAVLLAVIGRHGPQRPSDPPRERFVATATGGRDAANPAVSAAEAARRARAGLVLAARVIARTEDEALTGAFAPQLPRVLREPLSRVLEITTGGRG
jgi:hypothetical protein